MKTKEFIKLLKEADPEGNAHIRMDGGIPFFVELKEGYWDGAYSYINEDEKYVTTTTNFKVDVHCMDMMDFIWEHDGNMEILKDMFIFNFDGYNKEIKQEKEKKYWDFIEKEARNCRNHIDRSNKDFIIDVINNIVKQEWIITQDYEYKIGHYGGFKIIKNNRKKIINQGSIGAIITSGLFYPIDTPEYRQWIFDPVKGKNYSIK